MPRGVFLYADPASALPKEIALDTCFVVDALHERQPRHRHATAFLAGLVENQTRLVYNRLLEIELADTASKLAVAEIHAGNVWDRWATDGRVRRRAGRIAKDMLDAFHAVVALVPSICVELEEVVDAVPNDMRRWGLRSNDAVMARTALYAASGVLVTNDKGLARVPEAQLRLYADAAVARGMQEIRGARPHR